MFRINQFLAKNLNLSRRKADTLIQEGKVEFNGQIAELHNKVGESDRVKVFWQDKWQELEPVSNNQILLFYKPIFCLTTSFDPQKRKTIYDFLPRQYEILKPAGRLDYLSEGLLVLSNDGDLLQSLMHPSNDHIKEYLLQTKYKLSSDFIKKSKEGMVIDDYKLHPVEVQLLSSKELQEFDYLGLNPSHFSYKFCLQEGRNNQIRKMLDLVDQKALRLVRIKHGEYALTKELKQKKYIEIKNT